MNKEIKSYITEMLGTFFLILFGCMSVIIFSGNKYMVAITFGITASILIYLLSPISGCHMNPAVTLAFYLKKDISGQKLFFYWLFQLIGSFLTITLLGTLRNDFSNLGSNKMPLMIISINSLNYAFGIMIEAILVASLILSIFYFSKYKSTYKSILIGVTPCILIMIGANLTSASLNPFRSLAPAIFEGGVSFNQLIIFLVGPMIGGLLAAMINKLFRRKKHE